MKERPIIFNGEQVRAILDGDKTQTRRIIKTDHYCIGERDDGTAWPWREDCENGGDIWYPCPYGKAGDRLWVRETFEYGLCTKSAVAYRATHKSSDLEDGWHEKIKWKPSIQMPRWASRITLEITSVRVERLQDISEHDAEAEGSRLVDDSEVHHQNHRAYFSCLWDSINGKEKRRNWIANPWVWVIEFKRV